MAASVPRPDPPAPRAVPPRLRVGVIYGGRSGEHEVSVASAASVCEHLPRERYDPVPILIGRDGRWSLPSEPPRTARAADVIAEARRRRDSGASAQAGREVVPLARPGAETLLVCSPPGGAGPIGPWTVLETLSLDVVFPVLHGPYGEDGTLQGLLELADVPYVGAGVLGSAVGMDKAVSKRLFAARGLPVAEFLVIRDEEWAERRDALRAAAIAQLGLPVFVKPANLGSSVGISKVKTADALGRAIDLACSFDRKAIVEAAVPAARELEVAVLGNDRPEASVPGEIVPSREFYDYEAKYVDGQSVLHVPAPVPATMAAELQRLAVEAFLAVEAAGMARVDFLVDGRTGRIVVNEVNTIPGFTTISMYPKLWAASGLDYPVLLDRLIGLALERHRAKQRLRTSLE